MSPRFNRRLSAPDCRLNTAVDENGYDDRRASTGEVAVPVVHKELFPAEEKENGSVHGECVCMVTV